MTAKGVTKLLMKAEWSRQITDGLEVVHANQQISPRETSQWNQFLPLCGFFQPYRLISCSPFKFRAVKLN